ncbi:MAG: hypothetical protein K6G83_08520 [Lachnospiraceae bacterium]|nr:hypothetical protein [Lachnospiraceae bacterium]
MNHDDYSDIINHPHYQSKTRPHMSLHDRAAQFAPFAALVGYDAEVKEAGKVYDERIFLCEDALDELDQKLAEIAEDIEEEPRISVTWFVRTDGAQGDGGTFSCYEGSLKKIDGIGRKLVFTDGKEIPISAIEMIDRG